MDCLGGNGVIHAMDGFTDNSCFNRNSNRGFYCSRNSVHKIIFVKICFWSNDSSGIARV